MTAQDSALPSRCRMHHNPNARHIDADYNANDKGYNFLCVDPFVEDGRGIILYGSVLSVQEEIMHLSKRVRDDWQRIIAQHSGDRWAVGTLEAFYQMQIIQQ